VLNALRVLHYERSRSKGGERWPDSSDFVSRNRLL
jgi:hypothetical protein